MAAALAPGDYKEVMLFLGTAGVVVPLFHRLKISPVLGFLGAGALLGPYGLGSLVPAAPWLSAVTIQDREEIQHLAEFGVVFLLFMIGVELSWERLRTLRRLVFGFGSLQVVLSAAAIGGVVYAAGAGLTAAILVGLALALSSTAIVIPVLAGRRRLSAPAGRASFSVLLFQDLAVAPILFAVAVLGTRGNGESLAASLVWALAQAAVALVVIVGVGRLGLRPLFQLVAATRSTELFMAACLLVVIGTGFLAASAGLSMALGAFIAGLLLAETEYRRAIEATIDPFKGLLLGVFFVSVGMSLDVSRLAQAPGAIFVAALGLIALKALIAYGIGRAFGLARAVALEAALLVSAGGEFAFVILGGAMGTGLVPYEVGQAVLVVTTVTMIAIPGLARVGASLSRRADRAKAEAGPAEPPPPEEAGRVIVAGYGRVGQLVGEMLARHRVPFIAIDADPVRVRDLREAGKPVYVGDSTNREFLRACGLENARALVVTLDTTRSIESVVAAARMERPDITIVARARDAKHATALYELGVDDAVPETIEASLQLSEAVLVDIGVPMGLVIASVHERREEFRRTLKPKGMEEEAAAARADAPPSTLPPERTTEFRGRRSLRRAQGS